MFVISNPREGSMVLQQDVRYFSIKDFYISNVLFERGKQWTVIANPFFIF